MPRITVTITDEQADLLTEKTADGGEYESKSEVVRNCITGYEHLEERVAELETENERLRREKRLIIERREDHTELQEYVEEERSWRSAGLGTRVKWWLFGRGD